MYDYYLKLGDNDPAVSALRACLNGSRAGLVWLDQRQVFDLDTRVAVIRVQHAAGAVADGVVGPRTWAALGKTLGYAPFVMPALTGVPIWARNLLLNAPDAASLTTLDVGAALSLYERVCHRKLDPSQSGGLTFLLGKIVADPGITDVRWAAYMLATVKHECAEKWQPIEESAKLWTTMWYGKEKEVKDAGGNTFKNRYYGRGYVQLTTPQNYEAMGIAMGLGNQLLLHPEQVTERELAYKIMSHGMRNGSFDHVASRGLRSFIHDSQCDYFGARAIINTKNDCADLIAGYARDLEIVLLGAITNVNGMLLGSGSAVCR
jgi:hypothetical protein